MARKSKQDQAIQSAMDKEFDKRPFVRGKSGVPEKTQKELEKQYAVEDPFGLLGGQKAGGK